MNDNVDVYDDLRQILERVRFTNLSAQLSDDLMLQEDLNVDSPMLVEIVLDIEERYSIRIGDEEIGRLRRVGDLVKLISEIPSMRRPGH